MTTATPPSDLSREQLLGRVTEILHETFDIELDLIRPEAHLGEDLDIDSIDAIDLIVQLKPLLGGNLQPEAFRSVRTVNDVIDALESMVRPGVETDNSH